MQRLRRVFWSLYGRFVWDAQKEQAPQVRRSVEILQALRVQPGERVLDAGCGTGNYALDLAQGGFHVAGIDYAAGMLARAQAFVMAASLRGASARRFPELSQSELNMKVLAYCTSIRGDWNQFQEQAKADAQSYKGHASANESESHA